MWLPRMMPLPKPCTASVSSSESNVLCSITTPGPVALMQNGEEQCRNVESAIVTEAAVAARSNAAPAPSSPPSRWMPENETPLEVATLTCAGRACGRDLEAADDDPLRAA